MIPIHSILSRFTKDTISTQEVRSSLFPRMKVSSKIFQIRVTTEAIQNLLATLLHRLSF